MSLWVFTKLSAKFKYTYISGRNLERVPDTCPTLLSPQKVCRKGNRFRKGQRKASLLCLPLQRVRQLPCALVLLRAWGSGLIAQTGPCSPTPWGTCWPCALSYTASLGCLPQWLILAAGNSGQLFGVPGVLYRLATTLPPVVWPYLGISPSLFSPWGISLLSSLPPFPVSTGNH